MEKCKVNVEILGFTTREWKGVDRKKNGRQLEKLNIPEDLMIFYIIYKDADTTWSNCKNNLGLILKDGLLKENMMVKLLNGHTKVN